ncbi:hypothetical protein OG21DRAFT_1556983 [Imleria badia]|nr:hypothetical protein OG21DRAFT_1556983 [Imleria badia]
MLPPSKPEAIFYYSGLPSGPHLVYRTGTTPWEEPTGPEAYRVLKEVKPVFSHKIVTVWDDLGPRVCGCLDSVRVTWTSVDVVRFAVVGEALSLSIEDAHTAAVGCQELLESYKITDVEVEFRESVFSRSAGPKLLESVPFFNATASVRGPLTPALGLRIATRDTPYAEGTGALYIPEGGNSEKVFILSTRHVVFPPNAGNNELYNHTNVSQPPREVLLPGPKAFQTLLESTMVKIRGCEFMIDYHKQQLTSSNLNYTAKQRTGVENMLKEEEKASKVLDQFHDEIMKYWSKEDQRVIGHVAYSPPITVGTGPTGYTADWALIELDRNKIDWDTFKGNVIDLGTEIHIRTFTLRMYPDRTAPTFFKYPFDRLLPLQGVIEEDELLRPQMLDADGERCLIVIKSGCTTGVTIGRATGAKSFVREYFPDGTQETSVEWAILPYDQKSGAFSASGDSGAIIVDDKGRIGGLLTGGAGKMEDAGKMEVADVTYASPFYWLLQRIQTHFPNTHLY